MIRKIITNLKNKGITFEDINYVLNLNNKKELGELYSESSKNNSLDNRIKFESNIYYPTIYQIEDNCPTCGYRTIESRRKYTEPYIRKIVEYKLSDIKNYNIKGINCYDKDTTGIKELEIILDCLEKYNISIAVRLADYNNIKILKNRNINSIIYSSDNNFYNSFNQKTNQNYDTKEEEVIKYIKEEMNMDITYELMINYGESNEDIFKEIKKLLKYDVDSIQIKGYDPFIDCPEEYNPQYNIEYLSKIICILRLIFPDKELKIQYATNNNNYFKEFKKLGINTITGIYTPKMSNKLQNTKLLNIIENL
ncbi:MAG: hypothetical protein IJJ47_05970 [Methanosphaera sp.]|nr:hypothetical protein [Methanosphaera sp.]